MLANRPLRRASLKVISQKDEHLTFKLFKRHGQRLTEFDANFPVSKQCILELVTPCVPQESHTLNILNFSYITLAGNNQ